MIKKLPRFLSSPALLFSLFWVVALFRFYDVNPGLLQTSMGLFVLCFLMADVLYKKFHPVVGLAYAYFAAVSIPRIYIPLYFWQGYQINEVVSFGSLVGQAFLYMSIFVFGFYFLKDHLKTIGKILCWLSFCNAAVIGFKLISCTLDKTCHGFFGFPYFMFNNPAIDMSFMACTIPLFLDDLDNKNYFSMVAVFLISLLCVLSFTSSGILGFGLSISAFYWAKSNFSKRFFIFGLSLSGVIATLGYVLQGKQLIDSSGRFNVWKIALDFWVHEKAFVTGLGLGTFSMYGPAIQIGDSINHQVYNARIDGFIWAHNDWLQVLFEAGVVGFLFSSLVFFVALWRARGAPKIFAGLLTFGALAFIQMPTRHFVFTALGAYLVSVAFYPRASD